MKAKEYLFATCINLQVGFDLFKGIHGLNDYHTLTEITETWIWNNWHQRENILNTVISTHHLSSFPSADIKAKLILFFFFLENQRFSQSKDNTLWKQISTLFTRRTPNKDVRKKKKKKIYVKKTSCLMLFFVIFCLGDFSFLVLSRKWKWKPNQNKKKKPYSTLCVQVQLQKVQERCIYLL